MTRAKTRFNRIDVDAERVNLYLSKKVYSDAKEAARESWTSVSAWIDEACAEKLERDRKSSHSRG